MKATLKLLYRILLLYKEASPSLGGKQDKIDRSLDPVFWFSPHIEIAML